MRLDFLRHGRADWPDWEGDDAQRPLTKAGIKETQQVAKFLRKIGVKPVIVFSSPLPRAYQTAKIASKELGAALVEEEILSPGCTAVQIRALLKRRPEKEIMVVGHEPDFSTILEVLTGARLKLSKSGFARVNLDEESWGRLTLLFSPKVATA
jgi:phosphohistidine phosphatase